MKIGLNVGSGQRPFKSTGDLKWYNIDSQQRWVPDICCSGDSLVTEFGEHWPDDTCDYVVLHHVLEHFGCGEGAGLVKEAHRVLRPGGSLLVFVPDLKELAQGWFAGKISTQIYMTNIYGAYMGSEDDRHKWGFDAESLGMFLNYAAGVDWSDLRYVPPVIPQGADVAHDWWILEMECVK
jgi:predicted SAM-dependent methyltransferase